MDLENSVAHRITPKTIDGTEYPFIEASGFNAKHLAGWKSPLMVMKRN